jgi:hypothetical protein
MQDVHYVRRFGHLGLIGVAHQGDAQQKENN